MLRNGTRLSEREHARGTGVQARRTLPCKEHICTGHTTCAVKEAGGGHTLVAVGGRLLVLLYASRESADGWLSCDGDSTLRMVGRGGEACIQLRHRRHTVSEHVPRGGGVR